MTSTTTPADAPLFERLMDTETVESRTAQAVATGLATVVMAPRRMPTPARRAAHLAAGVLGVAGGALSFRESPQKMQVAAAAGFGSALVVASVLGTALDEATEAWLRRRGMKRPRLLIGVAAGALAYVTSRPVARTAGLAAEAHADQRDEQRDEQGDEQGDVQGARVVDPASVRPA